MPVGFDLNVTYGLKPQVSSIKMVTVHRRSIFQVWVTMPQGQHHVSAAQQSWALFCGIRTWMSDQLRIPRVVITSFFSFPFEGDNKDCRTPQPCVMSFFLFRSYLFLISPCPHSRVYLQYRTIVQMNSQTRRSNSSQFSWLLVVLNNNLDLIAICSSVKTNPRLFVSICVPPNNPITACGATSYPGYHSFPKWAIELEQLTLGGHVFMSC